MPTTDPDADGSRLLTSSSVRPLLEAAIAHAGGRLVSWALEQVDTNPNRSTTATYAAEVDWPYGRRTELLGVSARAQGLTAADATAEIFADGERELAVWIYPHDPDLPGLKRAAYPEPVAKLCNDADVFGRYVSPRELELAMIGYRPRRRAVVQVTDEVSGVQVYLKVLRRQLVAGVARRHRLLRAAGVPVPELLATTSDHLLVLSELPGEPLAQAVLDQDDPCAAEDLINMLDAMPAGVAALDRRPPWAQTVEHYAGVVAQAVPRLERQLGWLVEMICDGLASCPPGNEPVHGDFHEGQVYVHHGKITGLLDVDTAGPGRRADDLACLVAHLSTIQNMNAVQDQRVSRLIRHWVPVFDSRVDPIELRLRSAAVIVSLATGPFRGQEPGWEDATVRMVGSAQALVRQVA